MNYGVVEARYVCGTSSGSDSVMEWLERLISRASWRARVFEPLRDRTVFQQFQIPPDFQTLAWPNRS